MIIESKKEKAFKSLSHQSQLYIQLTEAKTDYQKLLVAISYEEASLVKFYLDSGVSINPEPDSVTSPIFLAAVTGSPLITKMLLDYGDNPNFEHRIVHETILHHVFSHYGLLMRCSAEREPTQTNNLAMIAAIMLHAGLRLDTPNSDNKSPLDKFDVCVNAERKEQILSRFLEKINKADVNSICVNDVVALSPEKIICLSPIEEKIISSYRAGSYDEVIAQGGGMKNLLRSFSTFSAGISYSNAPGYSRPYTSFDELTSTTTKSKAVEEPCESSFSIPKKVE